MRTLFVGLALGVLVLFGGAAARAGNLMEATFSLTLTGLPPASFTAAYTAMAGAGTAAGGPGSTAAWNVQANRVPGGIASATINSNAAPPLTYIQIIVNSNPSIGNFVHTAGGPMLLTGIANVWGLGGFPAAGPPLLGVPLKIGAPGSVMAGGFGVFITALANSWTTKTTTIGLQTTQFRFHTANSGTDQVTSVSLTAMGTHTLMGALITAVLTTDKLTGTNALAGGNGTVTLVSAVNVLTSISGQIPTFAVLTLRYVPEPSMLMMLAAGTAGLALLGRRKMRK